MNPKFHYIGGQCKKDKTHWPIRFIKGGNCVECERIRSKIRSSSQEKKEYQKIYQKKNKVRLRRYFQERLYGINYDNLLIEQNYCCAICREELDLGKRTHIDHKGSKVRGVLCHLCNVGIGHFRENEQYMFNAIEYLRKNK